MGFGSAVMCMPLLCVAAQVPPNTIFPAKLALLKTVENGKLFQVEGGDVNNMKVAHLYGDSHAMGYAQGQLLGDIALDFLNNVIPQFYDQEIDSISLNGLPEWLQKLVKAPMKGAAPAVFGDALAYVFGREEKYIQASPSKTLVEMRAMAEGICNATAKTCIVSSLQEQIKRINMLPELIKMTCSMFGAWGSATPTGDLVQLRTLDFGTGPFPNYTVLTVYHPDVGNPFASLGFPSFVGAITGFSSKVALSEKVWETYTDKGGVQPGHYDGLPVTLTIRDILQFSNTKEDAISYAQNTRRTWAVFLGVGDAESQQFRALGYREKDLTVISPANNKDITNQTSLSDCVYIDKHPQPSHDQSTLPNLMYQWHGKITGEVAVQQIARLEESGDMHVAAYDFGAKKVWISVGKVNSAGQYGPTTNNTKEWFACNRPYAEFDMEALFSEPKPGL